MKTVNGNRVTKYKKPDNKNVKQLDKKWLEKLGEEFSENPKLIMARNTVTTVGPDYACIDPERIREITHIFLNTVKKKDVRATNQGQSGRCWMFAGLNAFRHHLINAMNLDNFEFSAVYPFFYDKLERCNTFLEYFVNNHQAIKNIDDNRLAVYYIELFMSDGGWWNTFTNLVKKYGVVPKDAMQETASSFYSEEMDTIILDILVSTINFFSKIKNEEERRKEKELAMKRIYNCLVMFLGNPPKTFTWFFSDEDGVSKSITNITPQKFTELFFTNEQSLDDFVVLTHFDQNAKYPINQMYEIHDTKNVYEGKNLVMLNLPIEDLKNYTIKSLERKIPVHFGADVRRGFSYEHMALDEKLFNKSLLFGENREMTKGEKLNLRNIGGVHAMLFTGFNISESGKVLNFQVENSWGYIDNQIPGADGFYCATVDWFERNVTEVVIHKALLSPRVRKYLDRKPIMIDPWGNVAPASKCTCCKR